MSMGKGGFGAGLLVVRRLRHPPLEGAGVEQGYVNAIKTRFSRVQRPLVASAVCWAALSSHYRIQNSRG